MRTTKTVKVVMLATKKALNLGNNIFWYYRGQQVLAKDDLQQHLYLISDDEIKEGDWCYYKNGSLEGIVQIKDGAMPKTMIRRKIIATTDESLGLVYDESTLPATKIRDYYLPQIPESFIQAYIKAYNERSPITEIAVEYEELARAIGKNVDTEGFSKEHIKYTIKTRSDNTVIIHQAKLYTRDEVEKLCEKAFQAGVDLEANPEQNPMFASWIQYNL
jgi:hypothetical protein